jgi:hypothetical protein
VAEVQGVKTVGVQLCLDIAHALNHSLLEKALEIWKMQTEVTYKQKNSMDRGARSKDVGRQT